MISSLFNGFNPASACSTASIPYPNLFGAEFLSLEANYVTNHSQNVPIGYYVNHGAVNVVDVSFCNVTVSYTHPGQNDVVNVQVWMPSDRWNGRLQAIGGAGWQAGLHFAGLMGMTAAIGEGYATVGTDAGLGSHASPVHWALLSEGNVNLYLLQNLGSTSLNDASVIAKSVVGSFYGQRPRYSYFNGCSQGGRQGLMLAQQFPDAYDGIAASAPAIFWNQLFVEDIWALFLMDKMGEYPPSCEIDAITDAALQACDGNDGIVDGVITDPDTCDLDARSLVGTIINCTNFGVERPISSAAASVVQGVWDGAKRLDNSPIWYGVYKGGALTGSATDLSIISTSCAPNGTCTRGAIELAEDWVRLFVLKNSSATTYNLSHAEFDRIAHNTVQRFESLIGTNDPDLSEFRKRGGKMIGFHGTTDSIIPARGSLHYYDAVAALDANVHDFYRLFLAPGINHCFGGNGAFPDTTFDALRAWVESGVAPDSLPATSVGTSPIIKRKLCPYPKRQVYDGTGNSAAGQGFSCV